MTKCHLSPSSVKRPFLYVVFFSFVTRKKPADTGPLHWHCPSCPSHLLPLYLAPGSLAPFTLPCASAPLRSLVIALLAMHWAF